MLGIINVSRHWKQRYAEKKVALIKRATSFFAISAASLCLLANHTLPTDAGIHSESASPTRDKTVGRRAGRIF